MERLKFKPPENNAEKHQVTKVMIQEVSETMEHA